MNWHTDPNRIWITDEITDTLVGEVVFPTIDQTVPDRVVVERVFVNPDYRGQGLAGKLMAQFCNYATEHHYQVKLMCPFAVKYFDRHPEVHHLLAK